MFKFSPRLGVVYDLTGKGETIVRGGWGIFYDRPQGNIVLRHGRQRAGHVELDVPRGACCPGIGGASSSSDPYPTLSLTPTDYDFNAPRVQQWNVGIQRKLPKIMVFDLAYVGSVSDDQIRRRQIN